MSDDQEAAPQAPEHDADHGWSKSHYHGSRWPELWATDANPLVLDSGIDTTSRHRHVGPNKRVLWDDEVV